MPRGLQEIAQLGKLRAEEHLHRGCTFYDKGEFDNAIGDYTEAIRLEPESATQYHGRALAYAERGEFDNAIADCTEARDSGSSRNRLPSRPPRRSRAATRGALADEPRQVSLLVP